MAASVSFLQWPHTAKKWQFAWIPMYNKGKHHKWCTKGQSLCTNLWLKTKIQLILFKLFLLAEESHFILLHYTHTQIIIPWLPLYIFYTDLIPSKLHGMQVLGILPITLIFFFFFSGIYSHHHIHAAISEDVNEPFCSRNIPVPMSLATFISGQGADYEQLPYIRLHSSVINVMSSHKINSIYYMSAARSTHKLVCRNMKHLYNDCGHEIPSANSFIS